MTDEQMKKVSNEALLTINNRLNQIQTKITNIWSSATSDNFQEVYNQAMEEIDKIYDQIDIYNESSIKLEQYNKNKARIKELQDLIANERAHPSKEVKYTYVDEKGKEQTGTKYVVDTDKINGWQTEINSLESDNTTLKTEIESLLAKILPTNLQPKNNHDIAHRGNKFNGERMDYKIKDNSLEAFINAGENGFWGAEADVIQDANGDLVCSHNKVKPGENPPTFEEYLDVCKEYGMTAIIDMKYSKGWSKNGDIDYVNKILDTINEKDMADSCVIQTNNTNDIINIRQNSNHELSEDARIWLLSDDISQTNINLVKNNNVECVNVQNGDDAIKKVTKLKENGIDSCVWAVFKEESKENLIANGATYIMSDNVLGITPYEEGEKDYNSTIN